jgi:hypothetical protein
MLHMGTNIIEINDLSICIRVLTEGKKISAMEKSVSKTRKGLNYLFVDTTTSFHKVLYLKVMMLTRILRKVALLYSSGLAVAAGEFYAINSDNPPAPPYCRH